MKTLSYNVRFLTPAFLGDAEQNGRWRTPPFKAQLRQWWRVAYAAEKNFQVQTGEMRIEEGLLFGNAWLSHREGRRDVADFTKSLVRVRLDRWDEGKLRSWQGLEQSPISHPEVERTGYRVGPHAYLAYGPLDGRGGTRLEKRNAAIQAGESAGLRLAVPETHPNQRMATLLRQNLPRIEQALWLMDRYGTAGGRSRNGWGSYRLEPVEGSGPLRSSVPLRDWNECLGRDWAHAIGKDEKGPLIWQTAGDYGDWKQLMRVLAIVKIGLRTQFVFRGAPGPEPRHWLSYPVTKHSVPAWGSKRLPNSLRFKVRAADGDGRKLVGVIFHAPCLPPEGFKPDRAMIVETWKKVHELLDELTKEAKQRNYASIADANRRQQLKPQLDTVRLKRIEE